MRYQKTSIAVSLLLLALLLLSPAESTKKLIIGSNTWAGGPEVTMLQSCAEGSACTSNATLGIEFGRAVDGVQVKDLDSDGLNDTSIYTALSNTVGQLELTTYDCDATGCRFEPSMSFDLPYGNVVVGDKQDFGNVDNSPDGTNEWVVGQTTASANAGRQEIRVYRCGTNEMGWYAQNASNGTNWNFRGVGIIDQDTAFIVGDAGVAYRWDGKIWNWENLATTNNTLDVACARNGEKFCIAGGAGGFLAYWNGTNNAWTKMTRPAATQVNRIAVYNSTLAWAAVGTVAATTNVWMWNGATWSTQTVPSATYNAVDFANSTWAWAVGSGGNIAFYNGATWATQTSPTATALNTIDVYNYTTAFAATTGGAIIRFNVSAWYTDTTPVASSVARVRFFNATKAVALIAANGLDADVWGGGGLGSWAMSNFTLPRYATYTDFAVLNGTTDAQMALAVGTNSMIIKYGNDTDKCFETNLSVNYYSPVGSLLVADINGDGANELVATGTTANVAANDNEFQVFNCTGGQCLPYFSTNHDTRGGVNTVYVGDVDGDGNKEVLIGFVSTINSAGTCGQNELCAMRCAANLTCANCGASCSLNLAKTVYSIGYGVGVEENQPAQGRILVGIDQAATAGNDIIDYKMGVPNGGAANTLTATGGGVDVGTSTGAAISYEMESADYLGLGKPQIIAPWAYLGNWTFGIHRCSGASACNYTAWFNTTVANYVEKYRDVVNDYPFGTTNASDARSDQTNPTTAGQSVTFSAASKTQTGSNWQLLVCDYPYEQDGSCDPNRNQFCKSASTASNSAASCSHDTTGESGNVSWFAFACDVGNSECSQLSDNATAYGRPYFVNGVPVVSAVSVSPSSPSIADNLTCNATITDDFNATPLAIVTWFKNGANQTALYSTAIVSNGTNTNTDTVLSGNLSGGDSWYCEVGGHDGYLAGAVVQASPVSVSLAATCNSCATCMTALGGAAGQVNLTADITGFAGTCINDPAGFSGKIFDCMGHKIAGDYSGTDYGIYVSSKSGDTIKNCNVSLFTDGIYLSSSTQMNLSGNSVYNNTDEGIYIVSGGNDSVTGNSVYNNTDGFYVRTGTANNTFASNSAHDNQYGFALSSAYSNIFISNSVYNNTAENMDLYSSAGNAFSSNNISGSPYAALLDASSDNNTFTSNIIHDNQYGFAVTSSYNNTFVSNSAYNNSYGFYLDTSAGNSTLAYNMAYNNTQQGFYLYKSLYNNLTSNAAYNNTNGFYLDTDNSTLLLNNTAYNNMNEGFYLYRCLYDNLTSNAAYGNGDAGFYIGTNSTSNNLTSNTARNNTVNGFSLASNASGNALLNNSAYGNLQYGIYLSASTSNNLTSNSAYGNSLSGIYLISNSNYTNLTSNTAYNNSDTGIYLTASSGNNTLAGNSLYNNSQNGAYVLSSYNNLTSNTAHDNYRGLYIQSGSGNSLLNNAAYNDSFWDVYIISSLGNSFANQTVGSLYPTKVTFSYAGDVFLGGLRSSAPADPATFVNLSKYVNVSNGTKAWLWLNFSYTAADLGTSDENTLRVSKNNGSWYSGPGNFSATYGVDTANDVVFANITDFRSGALKAVFAPLAVYSSDSIQPSVANWGENATDAYQGDFVKLYSQGNDSALSKAKLSTNETLAWVNYTSSYGSPMDVTSSNIWTWSNFTWRNATASGDIYWRIWYNDTSGNWNSTPIQKLSIRTPSASYSKSPVSACGMVFYQTQVRNSTGDLISSDLQMSLLNPAGGVSSTQGIAAYNLPDGIYNGSFLLPYGATAATWFLRAFAGGVSSIQSFQVGTGDGNVWRIDVQMPQASYLSGENMTANYTIYSGLGEGIAGLADNKNMSVFIDATKLSLAGYVKEVGMGTYNVTYNTTGLSAPASHYLQINANATGGSTISSGRSFYVRTS